MKELPQSHLQIQKKENSESQYLEVKFGHLDVSVGARVNVQLEIGEKVVDFITENFAQKEPAPSMVARVFSKSLIETKPKWNLAELDSFFKFIMLRRDLEELSSVVKYGRPVTALVLLDWIKVYEDEKRAPRVHVQSEPSTEKASPEVVDKFVKTIMEQIPKRQYTPPAYPLVQNDFKEVLQDMIPSMTKTELKDWLPKLKAECIVRTDENNKNYTEYYYQQEIDMINKRLK